MPHHRRLIWHLLPSTILPGLIYLVVSRFEPVLVALAAASALPLAHSLARVVRGKRPSELALVFVVVAGVSTALAFRLRSPLFILAKGAVISAVLGIAFAASAAVGRPLTRWLAIRLSTEHAESRATLRARWSHPRALRVFRALSVGWGALLLLLAGQQLAMALTLSPGVVTALDPVVHTSATVVGIAASVLYVRRVQRRNPEVAMLRLRAR